MLSVVQTKNTIMPDSDLPKPLWKSPIFLVSMAVCLLLFLFGGYLFFIWTPPLVISPATTSITGPLTAKGDIDFFKALEQRYYPPELATDDNGFRIFVRLFGDVSDTAKGSDAEFYRLQRYEKLGLDPKVPPTLIFPLEPCDVYKNFYRAKGETVPIDEYSIGRTPWTLEDYPMLEEWLKDIDAPLDAITEAIRKPVFFAPFLQTHEAAESDIPQNLLIIYLPDIEMFRIIARMFQARANYRIGQGNIDGAIDDKLTLHRLCRLVPQGGPLCQYLIGLYIEGVGAAIPVSANPEHPLTEQQIRRLLEGIDALPPRTPINNAFEWERLQVLDCIQAIARRKTAVADYSKSVDGLGVYDRIMSISCNWNIVCLRLNEVYDALLEPGSRTKFDSLVKKANPLIPITVFERIKFYSRFMSPSSRGNFVADVLIRLYHAPEVSAAKGAVRRTECAENLQRLSLAVLLYQCETSKLPDENWAAQIEKYLGENPQRYFSCPSNPSPEGQTTYAMVQYANAVGGSRDSRDVLMFVELKAPVALDKAVISADDVLNRRNIVNKHAGGINTAHHSAAVRFLGDFVSTEELRRLLGL